MFPVYFCSNANQTGIILGMFCVCWVYSRLGLIFFFKADNWISEMLQQTNEGYCMSRCCPSWNWSGFILMRLSLSQCLSNESEWRNATKQIESCAHAASFQVKRTSRLQKQLHLNRFILSRCIVVNCLVWFTNITVYFATAMLVS